MVFEDVHEPIDIVSRSQFKDLCQSLETAAAESLPRAYRIHTIGDGDLASTLSESAILHRVLSSLNSIPTIEGISRFHFALSTIEVDPEQVDDIAEWIEDIDMAVQQEIFEKFGDVLWANGCIDGGFPVQGPMGRMWVSIELVGTDGLRNRLFSTSIADVLVELSNMKQVCFQDFEILQSGSLSATLERDIRSNCTELVFRHTKIQGDANIILPHEILANLEKIHVQIIEPQDNQWTKKDEFFSEVMKLTSLKGIRVQDFGFSKNTNNIYQNSHSLIRPLANAIATQPNIPKFTAFKIDLTSSFSDSDLDLLLNAMVAKQISLKELRMYVPDFGENFALPKGLRTRILCLRTNREEPILIKRPFFHQCIGPHTLDNPLDFLMIDGALISRGAAEVLSHIPLCVLSLGTDIRTNYEGPPRSLDTDVVKALFHSESALRKSLMQLEFNVEDIPEPAMACLAESMAHLSSLKYLAISPSGREAQIPQLIHLLKQSKTITELKSSYEDSMDQRYDAILDVIVNRRKPRPPNFPGIENATPEQKQLAKSYSLQLNHFLLLNKSGVHKCLQRLESSDGISPIFLPGILNWIDQGHPREALYFLLRQRPASFASAYQRPSHQS